MNIYIDNSFLKKNNDDIEKLLIDYNNELDSIVNCINEMKKVWNEDSSELFYRKYNLFEQDLKMVHQNIKNVNEYINSYQLIYKKLNDAYMNKKIIIE